MDEEGIVDGMYMARAVTQYQICGFIEFVDRKEVEGVRW